MDLDPTYRDAFGRRLLRITSDRTDNKRTMVKWVADNPLTQIAKVMGGSIFRVSGEITDDSIVPYRSTRCQGGAIMGADRTTSAANTFGQTWDVSNLFVLGADNVPQNVGNNPTGTADAPADRAADATINQYLPNQGRLAQPSRRRRASGDAHRRHRLDPAARSGAISHQLE